MGYLWKFDEDVFISYAHNDDDAYPQEQRGWVAQLDEDLKKRVAVFLDGKKPSVWRDPEIRPNEDFEQKISTRLAKTAILLSVISPSFFQRDWCLRELEEFAAYAESTFGVRIDEETSRIFKVEKVPVDRSVFPEALRRTGSYKFYGPDPERGRNMHEFRPLLGGEDARSYFRQIDDLAQDIAAVLKKMAEKAQGLSAGGAAPLTVYVAETTSDLEEEAREIRRDLKDRGYAVVPSGDLPYRARDFKERVREALKRAVLSVHLVGWDYGLVPEGESGKSNEWLQHDLALERALEPNFERLIWMPTDLRASDPRQTKFIEYLQNDSEAQRGADLLESKIEDLKTALQEKLRAIKAKQDRRALQPTTAKAAAVRESPRETPGSGELLRIYIICDQMDLKAAPLTALRRYLFQQGYECILPSEAEEEREALQEHADNLEICDACLIYYGAGSERWFGTKLRDLRKVLSRRQRPVLAKALYLAPPETVSKSELETHEALVLRGGDSFIPQSIAPLLNRLRSDANREDRHASGTSA